MRKTRTVLKSCTITLLAVINLSWISLSYHPAFAFPYPNDSIWPVLVDHFDLQNNQTGQKDVQQQVEWYQRHPKYFHQVTINAQSYLYYIYQQTQKYHVPAEIALLPMIESDYRPVSRSSVGAEGLWQLMPGTASGYGVKMNWWYDGRRDVATSTRVAIRYLVYLHDVFDNNWLLAIAAYDAGSGTVQNAMRYNREHGQPTDFWALHLPRETEIYVPKLLALAAIVRHPTAYGFSLAPIADKPITTTVKIQKQMNIATIAHDAHISVHKTKELNPEFLQTKTPPHQSVTLVLPTSKAKIFKKQMLVEKKQDDDAKSNAKNTAVASPVSITAKSESYIDKLFDKLIGDKTTKPVVQPVVQPVIKPATKTIAPAKPISHFQIHVVHSGDNLRVLARRYHTTISHLMAINHLHGSLLRVGQKLKVPTAPISPSNQLPPNPASEGALPKNP